MKSVRNAIVVIETLATGGPAGVGDLARRTGIAKSTVQRCLETLAAAGWIESQHDVRAGRTAWRLTDRLQQLSARRGPLDLLAAAQPVMLDLRDATGFAIHLVVLDGVEIELLDRVEASDPIQVVVPIGYRVPAYASATGKAILAALERQELEQHLPTDLTRLTDETVTSRAALDAELQAIRSQGYAVNRGEWNDAVAAVAAAIVVERRPVAALSVSATPSQLSAAVVPKVAGYVRSATAAIASRLP